MSFIKKNYGWLIVVILAVLPLFIILKMVNVDLINNIINVPIEDVDSETKSTIGMLYHITGEFAIRWMTAVLTCTPFFILFGVTNLFVRQAMGIATAIWSFLHFIFFVLAEGFFETFTQVNYFVGLIAVLILIPLFFTSNRKSMKILKNNWKKLQSYAYVAIFLSLLHVAILDKTWIIYAIIVGLGFALRIPLVKRGIFSFRKKIKKRTRNIH